DPRRASGGHEGAGPAPAVRRERRVRASCPFHRHDRSATAAPSIGDPQVVRARHLLITTAAGLGLADASVVTLALPDLLVDPHTTVEGVAAVIGVYTVVLALALI